MEANKNEAAAVSGANEQNFRSWCAIIKMSCDVIGPTMVPIIAKQGRDNFGMAILMQRDPSPQVEFMSNGEVLLEYKGEEAAEFLEMLDKTQAHFVSQGLDYKRDDIALATILRMVADQELENNVQA